MDKTEFLALAEKVLEGKASEAELQQYVTILEHLAPGTGEWDEELLGNKETVRLEIKDRVNGRIKNKKLVKLFWYKWAAAACLIIAISVAGYFAFIHKNNQATVTSRKTSTEDVDAPVTARATIKLSDGRVIAVDSFVSVSESGVRINKVSNGKIIYEGKTNETVYNTLYNPRGSKVINMTLSDGSQVWLDAGSSITYPIAFGGDERVVQVDGQAYFEIAHNASMPFRVVKGNMNVTVLGTHFNVNAFTDESVARVTLLEGSVQVRQGTEKKLLRPGEQAQVKDGITVVAGVNRDEVLAWKNGFFHFESADLKTILRQVARWYDIEVIYEGPVSNEKFFSILNRNTPLSNVLASLQANAVEFRIDGKKLFVGKQ